MKPRLKKELKKPDPFISALEKFFIFVKSHIKAVILFGLAAFIFSASFFAYLLYEKRKEDELQYQLSKAASLYRHYLFEEDINALYKAEKMFENIARKKKGGISEVATLYLARIKKEKGEKKPAEELLKNLVESSKSPLLKKIAEELLKGTN